MQLSRYIDNILPAYRKFHLGPSVQRTYISGLVSADEFRWFWISWKNDVISYGRGNQRGEHIIGQYSDSTPSRVHRMNISSYGNSFGSWIIPSVYYVSGMSVKFSTHLILVSLSLHTGTGLLCDDMSNFEVCNKMYAPNRCAVHFFVLMVFWASLPPPTYLCCHSKEDLDTWHKIFCIITCRLQDYNLPNSFIWPQFSAWANLALWSKSALDV